MNRVASKIALITGGARGIGRETAKLLAREGARVIITDVLDDDGRALQSELGAPASYYHLDVSDEKAWQALTATIQHQYGRIDILFNNAGIMGFNPTFGPQDPEHLSLASWHAIHAINLDGVFLGCKYGIALMKEHGGSIINMSSRSGMIGIPHAAAYASSKAAVRNHSKTVAMYCAEQKYNIRCNSLQPAAILTSLWDPMLGSTEIEREKNIARMSEGIPLGHMGEPLDIAYAVLYLGSDESKYITGAELVIDGGILAGSSAAPQRHHTATATP